MAPDNKTHGDYTVGWICALPKEQTAATAMLDSRHGDLPKSPHDTNTYTLGSIGQHNVVIACLPKGKYGTNSAANIATLMVGTFPSIKVGLMVGIGGGIPPKVRLGDVVVSTPGGQFPGVVQWDLGKAKEDGRFERTGALNNPPNALLAALGKLETEHDLTGSKIPDYLDEFKHKYPKAAKKYLKSDSLQDVLFRADYGHVHGVGSDDNAPIGGDTSHQYNHHREEEEEEEEDDDEDDKEEEEENCRFCDKTKIVKRKRRGMRVHYGLIASGNQVIKDAVFRDQLNKELGGSVLCVEMEAAGLMNNFPCLVVRGICDYCDSHKNKAWQEYAAAAAAAFAKELLGCVQPSDVDGERLVKDVLNEVKRDLQRVHQKIEDGFEGAKIDLSNLLGANKSKNQEDVLNWLSQIDFARQQYDYITQCEPGTGQRLLDSTQYRAWLATSKQTLFCPGIPGAGKTIQSSILVNDLVGRFEDDTTVGVAYLYCNFQRQQEQKVEHLLANLIKQLAQNLMLLPGSVQALFDKHQKRKTGPVLEELSATLQSVVMSYSRVFIVIDALDECHDSDGSRTKLLDRLFSAQSTTELNLFATSRFIPSISKRFEGCPSTEIRPSHEDIFSFLDARMRQLPDFVEGDAGLQNEIKTAIELAIEGMFLLAQLYIDSLIGKRSPSALRAALKGLQKASAVSLDGSSAIDNAYKKAMERIQHQRGDLPRDALLILSWVVNARRQIAVPELQEALAVEIGKSALDEDNIPTVDHITRACAPLIVVDAESNIVRLVHYTTQEYFERTQNIWFKNAQIDIAKISMTYLSFSAFKSGFCTSQDEFDDRLKENKLYSYAAQNWGHHTREALALGWEVSGVVEFLECQKELQAWSQALMVAHWENPYGRSQQVPRQMMALHLTGYFGLHDVVLMLLAKWHDPNVRDTHGLTPLCWAARNGHGSVVKLLMENGADLELKDLSHSTPLVWAARNGHETVVKLLLAKEPNLEAKDQRGLTPLACAARNGHEMVTKLLLDNKADVNAQDKQGTTVLHWVTWRGREAILLLLLEHGANIETRNVGGGTALAAAVEKGSATIIKLLLENGAILNYLYPLYQSRKVWSSSNRLEGSAEYVIPEGYDWGSPGWIGTKERYYRNNTSSEIHEWVPRRQVSPLWRAAEKNDDTGVKLLRDRGAQLDFKDPHYGYDNDLTQFPLLWAAKAGHITVAKLLLERGDDANTKDAYGDTAILLAAKNGQNAVVSLLLTSDKVDADMKDEKGRTLLSYAADMRWGPRVLFDDVLVILLASGKVDADSRDHRGRTPLSYASESWSESTAQLLIDTGKVDPDSRDHNGRTPLSYATEGGSESTAQFLVNTGKVDPDSKDDNGRTPLSYTRFVGVAKILLASARVDVESRDKGGQTPLSHAACKGDAAMVRLLLEHGADRDSEDLLGLTPLLRTGDGLTALKKENYSYMWNKYEEVLGLLRLPHTSSARSANFLAKQETDMNATDDYGRSLLHTAAQKGLINVVRFLVEQRADVNAKDNDGWTPLHTAARNGRLDVVDFLIEQEADVNATNQDRWASLHLGLQLASYGGHEEVAQMLIDKGADVNVRGEDNNTALQLASAKGHEKVVQMLIDRGADVNARGEDNSTALQFASAEGHEKVVQMLIDRGADVNARGEDNSTALQFTSAEGHEKVVQMLIDRGADVNAQGGEHGCALLAAFAGGYDQLCQILIEGGANLKSTEFSFLASAFGTLLNYSNFTVLAKMAQQVREENMDDMIIQELLCLSTERQAPDSIKRWFFRRGISQTRPGIYGWTPAMCAEVSHKTSLWLGQEQEVGQTNPGPPMPKSWQSGTCQQFFDFYDGDRGSSVKDDVEDSSLRRIIQLRADYVVPADRDRFFFEVEFVTVGPECIIGVGFCHVDYPGSGMPGWEPGSWGYHGDDGMKYKNGSIIPYGPKYGAGDIIGCGINFITNSAFFTKNGQYLGEAFTKLKGRLLPMCGIGERGVKLRVNFGDRPFVYCDTPDRDAQSRTVEARNDSQ